MFSLSLVMALAAIPQGEASTIEVSDEGYFGSQWTGKDGLVRHPNIEVSVSQTSDGSRLDPTIFRLPALDVQASNLNNGRYPKAAMSRDESGVSTAAVTISAEGKISECSSSSYGGSFAEKFNEFTCAHLSKNAQFHPALDTNGKRVAFSTWVTVFYTMLDGQVTRWNYGISYPLEFSDPVVDFDGTLKFLGLDENRLAGKGVHVAYRLDLNDEGKAIACQLTRPTYYDHIDFEICSKLMARSRFKPLEPGSTGRYWGRVEF